jgi:dephospho-CoA kinase
LLFWQFDIILFQDIKRVFLKESKCIVITGSIGCGKSSVCRLLQKRGYEIIDADAIGKKLFDGLGEELKITFGDEIVENGEISRNLLGKLVFEDKSKREKLEAIMHPKIKEAILSSMKELEKKGKIYFVDIPLFFETKNYTELSPVAVVYAPRELQLSRIVARGGIDLQEATKRVNSQIDIDEKVKMADFIINNSGEQALLDEKIDIFLKEVREWFCKNTAQAETIF